MKQQQSGFTLIELIMVIVILGSLAAVALPKYQDLSTNADKAVANGIYGAAQAAAAINFSKNLVATVPAGLLNTTAAGTTLQVAMGGNIPTGWTASTAGDGFENGTTYKVLVTAAESTSAAAVITCTGC